MFTQRILGVFIDIIVITSFYYGTVYSMEGLINIGYFTGWLFGVCNLLAFGLTNTTALTLPANYKPRSLRWKTYDILSDTAYVAFAAYSGWFILASVFAAGAAFKVVKLREIERKLSH